MGSRHQRRPRAAKTCCGKRKAARLFLEEIRALPLHMQTLLLSLIEGTQIWRAASRSGAATPDHRCDQS